MTRTLEDLVLVPEPRRRVAQEGGYEGGPDTRLACVGDPRSLMPVAEEIQASAQRYAQQEWAIGAGESTHDRDVRIEIKDGAAPPQGYRLRIAPEGVVISAPDAAGAFHGAMTLRQMMRQVGARLPAGEIEDAPDFPLRGLMLDISRDKVPTMQTLYDLVDQLAELKLNHLELYTEHTFAYREHPDVWAQSSPMTGEQIMRLEAYARRRHVELAPNQNCFGHLHRWLDVPRYRHLAECPDGFDYPWGAHRDGPYSLDPTNPQCLEFIAGLLDELLPHFSSRKINVGCDEVWDLGRGHSRSACEQRGRERVYLDFLLGVHKLVAERGRVMHFWADIVLQKPPLLKELPDDVVALKWDYEVGDPFDEHGALLAEAGVPFHVCPGTSSWRSFTGRTDNGLTNIRDAAAQGLKHGASGMMATEWGDQGYWQYLPFAYLGITAAASLSWCESTNRSRDFVDALDTHVFQDRAERIGRLLYDMGNYYHRCGELIFNGTPLFPLMESPFPDALPEYLTEARVDDSADYVNGLMASLDDVHLQRPDAALIKSEIRNSVRMFNHACARARAVHRKKTTDRDTRLDLASDLRRIIGEHRRLWLSRNREGGLHRSAGKLIERLREYEGTHDAV